MCKHLEGWKLAQRSTTSTTLHSWSDLRRRRICGKAVTLLYHELTSDPTSNVIRKPLRKESEEMSADRSKKNPVHFHFRGSYEAKPVGIQRLSKTNEPEIVEHRSAWATRSRRSWRPTWVGSRAARLSRSPCVDSPLLEGIHLRWTEKITLRNEASMTLATVMKRTKVRWRGESILLFTADW